MTSETAIRKILQVKKDGHLYHRESQTLEFKEQFNLSALADYFRDFAAFANNRGGYLIFGVEDNPYRLTGLTQHSKDQFQKIDPEQITGYLLNTFSAEIEWEQAIHNINGKSFSCFYVTESKNKPVIARKDEGRKNLIKNGEIYYRYGGRTQKIQFAELQKIIQDRLEFQSHQWRSLFSKIAKAGPENAAVLDTEKGVINKNKNVLVLDDSLVNKIRFIKEGEFDQQKGKTALRLVGDVRPMNSVEVYKKEKRKLTDEYPYSALELCEKVKKVLPTSSQNDIWKVIKNNGLKDDTNYSAYNFRNKKQEQTYLETGALPAAVASIYNQNAVDFIIKVLRNN